MSEIRWPTRAERRQLRAQAEELYNTKGNHLRDGCAECCGPWDEGGWCQVAMKMDYQQLVIYDMAEHPDDIRHPSQHKPPFGTVGRK